MSIQFHTLRGEQWIPRPIDEVFAFFSDAHNLEEITPPWLKFNITSIDPGPIHAGTEIRYRLGWHGVPIGWTTEIRRWEPPYRFTDVQRSGPYSLWHHTHKFEAHGDQTRIVDIVRYALPFGFLGRMIHAIAVKRDVQQVFEYRHKRIAELFAATSAYPLMRR